MTEPLQSYDVELLKRYDAELEQLGGLPPAAIELGAREALALVTHMQIAAANPAPIQKDPTPLRKQVHTPLTRILRI
jgi:hypothetical protein